MVFLYAGVYFTASAGDYVIVMTMPNENADEQSIENTSETTSAPVTYVNSAFDGGSTFAYPNPSNAGDYAIGMFGPNFTYVSGAISEPSTWAMMLLGFAGLGFAGYRNARNNRPVGV